MLFVATLAAVAVSVMCANGWFANYDRLNSELAAQAWHQRVLKNFSNWTVGDLASFVSDEYDLDVVVSAADRSKSLDDFLYQKNEISLPNCLRLVLYPANLSIAVRYGKLEFVELEAHDVEWQLIRD